VEGTKRVMERRRNSDQVSSRLMNVRCCLEDGNNLGHCIALGGFSLPAPFDHLPHTIGELRVVRSTRPTSLYHRINSCSLAPVVEGNSPSKDLAPLRLRIRSEIFTCPPTHLPSQYTKCIYVSGCRGPGVGQSEALRFNQFRGSAVEEPIDFCM
jgi:hypothetical protein